MRKAEGISTHPVVVRPAASVLAWTRERGRGHLALVEDILDDIRIRSKGDYSGLELKNGKCNGTR